MRAPFLLLPVALLLGFSVMATDSQVRELELSAKQPIQTPLNVDFGNESKENRKMNQQQQVKFAKDSLAEQLGIAVDDISVVSNDVVTWRSGALGCPAEGRMYTQALVTGTRIILSAKDSLFSFHADKSGTPFLCPEDRAESPSSGPNDRF